MLKKSIQKIKLLTTVKPLALAVCTLLSTAVATQTYAAVGDKLGNEFLVNTVTAEEKQEPAIASNAAGASVITWSSRNQASANGGYNIYAQRYNANGVKEGNEFLVNVVGGDDKHTPDVALDTSGNFVIVWRSNQQDGNGFGVYGQLYNANGVKAGDEFLVNTNITDDQENPQVAMDDRGNFVVVWQSFSMGNDYDISAQRYSANGTALSGDFMVNSDTSDIQSNPDIAMNANGAFIITWQSGNTGVADIYAKRYQANGSILGSEFRVNTTTSNGQLNSGVAMDGNGAFTVVWDSFGQEPVPATSGGSTQIGVYAQRFDANGIKAGSDFLVNTETTDNQQNPNIAMNADGDFVVTWQSQNQTNAADGEYDIYAQRFNSTGNAVGNEFLANTEIEDNQASPVIAMDENGGFVIAWQSNNQVAGGVIDIYAQRYEGVSDNTSSSSGGGGAFGWLMTLWLLPFMLRRRQKAYFIK